LRQDVPSTIGWNIDKAVLMLRDFNVMIQETSTPFQDKKEERSTHAPVVVRQIHTEDSIYLTVARFK
jgi:hypothetical protein